VNLAVSRPQHGAAPEAGGRPWPQAGPAGTPVRVLIADDQPLVRHGLRASFDGAADIVVAGEAANGRDAVRAVQEVGPDVVLMDIQMPVMNGLESTREIIRLTAGSTKIIILSMFDLDDYVFAALRLGASGYVLKDAPTQKLAEAVRDVASGNAVLSPAVTRRLIQEFARRPVLESTVPPGIVRLTEREQAVLRFLVRGHRNEDIAAQLGVGESTVKSHVQHLYHKLGVHDRVQLVIYAYENGLV
jgi:DNA-binding NarL/FixJ family response regulator